MSSIGFTGTRNGLTPQQRGHLETLLESFGPDDVFHHGDCVGADAQAHEVALSQGISIHIHPPKDDWYRANCKDAAHIAEPKPYLERNHDIVDSCDVLIAMPSSKREVLRSGTWATIRYARKRKKSIVIAFPDGEPLLENIDVSFGRRDYNND